jgi:hypothetical protein
MVYLIYFAYFCKQTQEVLIHNYVTVASHLTFKDKQRAVAYLAADSAAIIDVLRK